eukprot:snap_masked-scaffold_93-processed-gene-0.23-mRNA-1 protein AED:1.00 eAED:1.00 QI:0/0/0/0/1/1/4/0/148
MFAGIILPRFLSLSLSLSLNVVLSTSKLHKAHYEPNRVLTRFDQVFAIQIISRLPFSRCFIQASEVQQLFGYHSSRLDVGVGEISLATILRDAFPWRAENLKLVGMFDDRREHPTPIPGGVVGWVGQGSSGLRLGYVSSLRLKCISSV